MQYLPLGLLPGLPKPQNGHACTDQETSGTRKESRMRPWPHKTPTLSRLTFQYIARIIEGLQVDDACRSQVAKEFADHLADTNAKFQRDVFLQAAGIVSESGN